MISNWPGAASIALIPYDTRYSLLGRAISRCQLHLRHLARRVKLADYRDLAVSEERIVVPLTAGLGQFTSPPMFLAVRHALLVDGVTHVDGCGAEEQVGRITAGAVIASVAHEKAAHVTAYWQAIGQLIGDAMRTKSTPVVSKVPIPKRVAARLPRPAFIHRTPVHFLQESCEGVTSPLMPSDEAVGFTLGERLSSVRLASYFRAFATAAVAVAISNLCHFGLLIGFVVRTISHGRRLCNLQAKGVTWVTNQHHIRRTRLEM